MELIRFAGATLYILCVWFQVVTWLWLHDGSYVYWTPYAEMNSWQRWHGEFVFGSPCEHGCAHHRQSQSLVIYYLFHYRIAEMADTPPQASLQMYPLSWSPSVVSPNCLCFFFRSVIEYPDWSQIYRIYSALGCISLFELLSPSILTFCQSLLNV